MAETINLGIVGIKNMGEYNSQTTYEKLNVVTYEGSTYCALKDTVGNLPTNTDYWQLYAQKGGKGDTGPQGPAPVKGVDYYTASDKQEIEADLADDIAAEVSSSLGSLTTATPLVASSVSEMTDTTRVYVNTTDGHWYWYDGNDWQDGGVYQSTSLETDKSFTLLDKAADSNYVGNELEDLSFSFNKKTKTKKQTIPCTFTDGRYKKDGTITTTSDYKYTQLIKVREGDYLQFTKDGSYSSRFTMANVACFHNNDVVPSAGTDSGIDRFTVPSGINYVRLSISKQHIPDTSTGYINIISTNNLYEEKNNNDLLNRLNKVDGLIIPELEYGDAFVTNRELIYNTPNTINEVRTPQSLTIPVHAGTIVGLKDYTNYSFQVHFTKPDSTYDSTTKYRTTDYVLKNDCNICIVIRAKTAGSINVILDDVKDLLVIEDSYNTINSKVTAGLPIPDFILPKKSFATVGHEWNLYFDNVMNFMEDKYYIKTTGIDGKQYKRFLRFTPTSNDIGNHTVRLQLVSKETDQVVKEKSFTLVVSDNTIESKKGIFIGDSLTAGGRYVYLITKVLNSNIESIGTLHSNIEGQTIYHEGRSGWSASNYVTDTSYGEYTNPFINPTSEKFDFSYYMAENNFSNIDFVMLNLGTNGQGHIEDTLSAMDEMIASIHDYSSSIKIFVSLITPPSGQDGCGNHNGMFSNDSFKYYELSLINEYLTKYEDKISNVYVTEPYFNIDVEYDFPKTTIPVSSRNPATMTINNNNVHPNQYGYEKMGDVYYNNIIGRL